MSEVDNPYCYCSCQTHPKYIGGARIQTTHIITELNSFRVEQETEVCLKCRKRVYTVVKRRKK